MLTGRVGFVEPRTMKGQKDAVLRLAGDQGDRIGALCHETARRQVGDVLSFSAAARTRRAMAASARHFGLACDLLEGGAAAVAHSCHLGLLALSVAGLWAADPARRSTLYAARPLVSARGDESLPGPAIVTQGV